MTIEVIPASLSVARETLERACDDLDDAVRGIAEVNGDNVMASPVLVGLLLRVVSSRRFVKELEAMASGDPMMPRHIEIGYDPPKNPQPN